MLMTSNASARLEAQLLPNHSLRQLKRPKMRQIVPHRGKKTALFLLA
jgi:hypothetical protein